MQKNALYYPHISMKNPAWIKCMALYYDTVYRIVPDGVHPDDDPELQPLIEDGSIGRSINPANYSQEASESFIDNLEMWNAAALTYDHDQEQEITRIHSDKTDQRVRDLFREAGYKTDGDWMHVPTELASNFMLYLAKDISSKNNLSLITNNWGAWTGTSYFSLNGQVEEYISSIGKQFYNDEYSESFGLFGLILNEVFPLNVSEIPVRDIVLFREKRKDEISLFRKCMHDLQEELLAIDSNEIRIDAIHEKARSLSEAVGQLKASADLIKAKRWSGVTLMGFPAPLVLGQLLAIPEASAITLGAAGLAIGGLYNIASTKEEIRKLKADRPESYLFELRSSFKNYTQARGGGDINYHAFNCMEEYVND